MRLAFPAASLADAGLSLYSLSGTVDEFRIVVALSQLNIDFQQPAQLSKAGVLRSRIIVTRTKDMNKPLFRSSAVNACHARWLGEIVLTRPLSFTSLTMGAVGMALVVVGFLTIGTYTKRGNVSGELAPDVGVLKVYVPQSGIVLQKRVREGQDVKRGDVLYLLSSERQSRTEGGIQATISRQVGLRQHSLRNELVQTIQLQKDEERALNKRIDGLQAEMANVVHQLLSQRARIVLAEAAVSRSAQLLAQG